MTRIDTEFSIKGKGNKESCLGFPPRDLPKASKLLIVALAGYTLLSGLSTLIGWFGGIQRLTDWLGTGIAMFGNTALAATCASIALLLQVRCVRWTRPVTIALGCVVGLIGSATLFEHISGRDLGIDSLLIPHRWGTRAAMAPGRMGPPASISFALLGAGLLLMAGRTRARRAVPSLAILVIGISLLAVTGYLFGADPLFAAARTTGIALQTATILLALAVALLATEPGLEPIATLYGNSAGSLLMRRALPFLFVIPIALGGLFVMSRRAQFVDRGTGTAMLVLGLILCFCLVLWWCVADISKHEGRSRLAETELQRKNRELAGLLETAARLAAIVEHSEDAIFSTDLQGLILSWNRGACGLYGYSADEVIGKPISILLPEGRDNEQPGILERVRRGQPVENYETTRRRKDGSVFAVSLTVSPVKDSEGNVIGASKVARDITEKLRAREILEQTVAERTASLTEALAQMEEFSYSVSHDLRAPVRAVRGFMEVALEDYGPTLAPELRMLLERTRASGKRMEQLINDILEYSKVTRAQLKIAPVSLNELLPAIIREEPALQSSRATVSIRLPLDPVLGHESCLSQAVTNLLRNAVKFVSRGVTPSVQVWTERHNGSVRLWIRDNGIGVKPQHHDRLFRLFERAHDSPDYEGTGIGLAIVRKSVDKMGGRAGLESDGVSGSSFWIELPAVSA